MSVFLSLTLVAACAPDVVPPDSPARDGSVADHVTFFGVGKVARYQQQGDSSLEALEPLFFAEIFIAAGGTVSNASVTFPAPPGGEHRLEYRYSESDEVGDVMYLSALADDDEALERSHPSSAYQFDFQTPGGDVIASQVSFAGGSFPKQPIIIFEQDGTQIDVDQVDPSRDLTITWPPFEQGRADNNGILDDLIFVAIDSCKVEDLVHSGRPFEKDDYLKYNADRYIVTAGTLEPGQTYSMYVEHALLPATHLDVGVPAFATFAASTYMDFRTSGNADPAYCHD